MELRKKSKSGITIWGVCLIAIAGIMMFTNPSKQDYVEYASEQLVTEIQNDLCGRDDSFVGNACKGIFKGGILLGDEPTKNFVTSATKHQNFIFFSIYHTKTPVRNLKTVGIFNNFITFSRSPG